MAKVGNNLITTKLSGMLGDQIVFRTRGNNTYVSVAPSKSTDPPTESQKEHRHHFQEAVIYGKNVNASPEQKEAYEQAKKGNQTAFNVAVADFMKAPHIDEVDFSDYSGQSGEAIRIRAVDDFMVVQVNVSIFDSDSQLLEEGQARQEQNGLDWIYSTSQQNDNLQGSKIVITASDVPGNRTESEMDVQ